MKIADISFVDWSEPMEIKNAYIVNVYFNGEIDMAWEGARVFAGEGSRDEAKAVLKNMLDALNKWYKKHRGYSAECWVGYSCVSINEILGDEELLDRCIDGGCGNLGNWSVTVEYTGK